MPVPEAAESHYATMLALQALAVTAGQRAWEQVAQADVVGSWMAASAQLLPVVEQAQFRAAFEGSTYSAMTLAEQAGYVAPSAVTNVAAFAGYASDGRPLDSLLMQPALAAVALLGSGSPVDEALTTGSKLLGRILSTQIADAGRQAAGVDVAAREGVGYVRMTRPGACDRCAIQAGKWFRWNSGFLRHPQCSCVHVANRAGSTAAALSEGLVNDPYKAFRSLPAEEQDRIYGQGAAQAIRDGADIRQVVNASRGMTPNGMFTLEGTTKYGNAAKGLKPGQRRLTPEGIYDQARRFGKDRAWTLELLQEHGYILPGGQVPTGSLRGQVEGFGQLGGGGQRRGAREAIEEARRTGVRDPRNRYTMTAAERRLYDARRRYEVALGGISPYTSPGFGNTPDPFGLGLNRGGVASRPVTPTELARAEKEYRAYLATNGQIFDR